MSRTSISLKTVELLKSVEIAVTFNVKLVGVAQETSIELPV